MCFLMFQDQQCKAQLTNRALLCELLAYCSILLQSTALLVSLLACSKNMQV